jgi:hypothetical protein
VPDNRLADIARAAVVQQIAVPAHGGQQADTPQRRRAPFAPGCCNQGQTMFSGKSGKHLMLRKSERQVIMGATDATAITFDVATASR